MVEHETIKWGMFDETPHIRGEKHIKYLIFAMKSIHLQKKI